MMLVKLYYVRKYEVLSTNSIETGTSVHMLLTVNVIYQFSNIEVVVWESHYSWNSANVPGTRECKELDINVKCDHRANVRQARQVSTPPTAPAEDTYVLDTIIPVEE